MLPTNFFVVCSLIFRKHNLLPGLSLYYERKVPLTKEIFTQNVLPEPHHNTHPVFHAYGTAMSLPESVAVKSTALDLQCAMTYLAPPVCSPKPLTGHAQLLRNPDMEQYCFVHGRSCRGSASSPRGNNCSSKLCWFAWAGLLSSFTVGCRVT